MREGTLQHDAELVYEAYLASDPNGDVHFEIDGKRRLVPPPSTNDAVLALRFDCAGPDGACAAVEFGLDRAGAGDAAALPAGGGSSDVVLLASAPAGDDLAWAACAVAVDAAPAAVAPDLDPSLLARVFGAETPPRTATRRGEAVVLLVAGATSYDDGADPRETCVARLAGAARRGWDDLRGRHVADFRAAAGHAKFGVETTRAHADAPFA